MAQACRSTAPNALEAGIIFLVTSSFQSLSPLAFLGPAIELIGNNASVLPASGGAFEDMPQPDVEEADDRFFGSPKEAQEGFRDFAEPPLPCTSAHPSGNARTAGLRIRARRHV